MQHRCLNASAINWQHDDPCTCECTYCGELRRLRALGPFPTDQEVLEKWWNVYASDMTPGPWSAVQLPGFGANNYLVSQSGNSQVQWYKIVAQLENINFPGADALAYSRDAVPRMLLTIEKLLQENQELKAQLANKGTP